MHRRKFFQLFTIVFSAITAGKVRLLGSDIYRPTQGILSTVSADLGESINVSSFVSNPTLKTILPNWKGTPINTEGRFMNHEYPFLHRFGTVMKWMMGKKPQKQEKKNDKWQIEVLKNDDCLSQADDMIVWLGHATFFIQINGIRILTDPVLGKIPMTKRLSELPITSEKLTNIDYILISHAHYDHCDKKSLKFLAKLNPDAHYLTGLNLDKLIYKWTKSPRIQAAGWYQQYQTGDNIELCYLPSRHWSNRKMGDVNTTLWGGFCIKIGDKTLYYGGDSGYGSHFKQVGELFPNIDVAFIGTGAYAPSWFMAPNHQDPESAVKAFNDTKARTMIPFHYGTFSQGDEPPSEPERWLRQLEQDNRFERSLKILKLGEVFNI